MKHTTKPPMTFTSDALAALEKIKTNSYSVLVGPNNCGKSFALRTVAEQLGESARYLGPNRYNNFELLGEYQPNASILRERFHQFLSVFRNQNQNADNAIVNLQQAIAELSDTNRATLMKLVRMLLTSAMSIEQTDPKNSMSQRYVASDGHNISYTSSGYRLITTILTCLLDDKIHTFLIDEPELGISPAAQGALSDFLSNPIKRKEYFPHVTTLVFATHSSIFLDRSNLGNNFSVSKRDFEIDIQPIRSAPELNRLQFFLLGNRLETMYLPSLIIVVEGKTDNAFISRVLELEFPGLKVSLMSAGDDGQIKKLVYNAKELLGDFQKSPYRERFIVVLDETHEKGIVPYLEGTGLPKENIVVWDKNGIEYYYPPEILDTIYGLGGSIEMVGDVIKRNEIEYSKAKLSEEVVKKLRVDSGHVPEFADKIIAKIEKLTGTQRQSKEIATPGGE